MNNLKKKVMASAAMLLVAAIMMTGSSFAWYTISTKGEMTQIKAELKATDNLEIARAVNRASTPSEVAVGDEGNQEKWGSTVTEWGTVTKLDVPATATASSPFVATVQYDAGGRVKNAMSLLTDSISSATSGAYTTGTNKFTTTVNGKTVTGAVGYAVWLRSNNTLNDIAVNVTPGKSTTSYRIRYKTKDATTWTNASTSGTISVTKDVPVLVEIIVYAEGELITAADVEDGIDDDTISVTFTSATIDAAVQAGNNNAAQKKSSES